MLTYQMTPVFGQSPPPPSDLSADDSCLRVYEHRPVRDLLALAALTQQALAAINAKEGRANDSMIVDVAAFLNAHAADDRTAPASGMNPDEVRHICTLVSNAYVRGEGYIQGGQATPEIQLTWTALDAALRQLEPVTVGPPKPTAPGLTPMTAVLAATALAAFTGALYFTLLGGPRRR